MWLCSAGGWAAGPGRRVLHRMTRLHAAVPPALLPKQQRRGPGLFLSGPPGPGDDRDTPAPSAKWAVFRLRLAGEELVESLGIEVNPAAGLRVGIGEVHNLPAHCSLPSAGDSEPEKKKERQLVEAIA